MKSPSPPIRWSAATYDSDPLAMTHPDWAPLRCSPCLHPPPGPQQRGLVLVARDMGIGQAPKRASNRAGHRFPYGLFEQWAAWFDPWFGPWSTPQPSATWQFQKWSHRSWSISGYPHLGGSQLITYNHAGIETLRSNMRQLGLYTNIPRFMRLHGVAEWDLISWHWLTTWILIFQSVFLQLENSVNE